MATIVVLCQSLFSLPQTHPITTPESDRHPVIELFSINVSGLNRIPSGISKHEPAPNIQAWCTQSPTTRQSQEHLRIPSKWQQRQDRTEFEEARVQMSFRADSERAATKDIEEMIKQAGSPAQKYPRNHPEQQRTALFQAVIRADSEHDAIRQNRHVRRYFCPGKTASGRDQKLPVTKLSASEHSSGRSRDELIHPHQSQTGTHIKTPSEYLSS
ncbi:hypothetical protein BDR06DRAFT_997527 [Suillus hirtellus]|nr:hypothetical protein BDR06DRAFT_997527 [Suillus hirtellus]